MADSALARVTGPVLLTEVRTGTARQSGNPYRIETVRVLVEDTGLAEFTVPDTFPTRFIKGETADVLVEFGTYGGRLQGRAVAPYDA